MSRTGLDVFDETVRKTNIWLNGLERSLDPIAGAAITLRARRWFDPRLTVSAFR